MQTDAVANKTVLVRISLKNKLQNKFQYFLKNLQYWTRHNFFSRAPTTLKFFFIKETWAMNNSSASSLSLGLNWARRNTISNFGDIHWKMICAMALRTCFWYISGSISPIPVCLRLSYSLFLDEDNHRIFMEIGYKLTSSRTIPYWYKISLNQNIQTK